MAKPKKQFSRPSITLSEKKRDWRDTPAGTLKAGDIVSGMGLVTLVETNGDVTTVHWKNGTHSIVLAADVFFAFVEV